MRQAFDDEDEATLDRVAETRRRHGDDFYSRIGRKSWEVRRRALSGDAAAQALLARRREARARRKSLWQELALAQEAVTLLRDELYSRVRANSESSRAGNAEHFRYTSRLRQELMVAEARLTRLRSEHNAILETLKALPDGEV